MSIITDNNHITSRKRPSSAALCPPAAQLPSLLTEIRLFLELAIPTTLLSAGFSISPLLTASYVGRKFGVTYLSGFALASLTSNLTTFSLLSGLFSAADTLGPQAFGRGDYREVGLIAIRGFVVTHLVLIPINVALYFYMEPLLILLGQDEDAAHLASSWYNCFVFSVPFCVLYNCLWKFLSAQHIMKPLILVSVFSWSVILPLGLELLTEHFGYVGSAYAYVNYQASQALLLLAYLCFHQPHTPGTWPTHFVRDFDKHWKEAVLQWDKLWEFLDLGLGGVLAQSEWLFWESLGLLVGQLGVVPLSVHTIPNQVTMVLCSPPFAAGIALAIRMGVTLPKSVAQAKKVAIMACTLITVFFGLVELVVYYEAELIIGFFTNDSEVMELAQHLWWKVCIFNALVAMFAILNGVATGLGQQWTLGYVNFFFLFIVGLPIIYALAIVQDGGLNSVWTWINFPYLGMNAALMIIFAKTNWHSVQDKILKQSTSDITADTTIELDDDDDNEAQLVSGERQALLDNTNGSALETSSGYGTRSSQQHEQDVSPC